MFWEAQYAKIKQNKLRLGTSRTRLQTNTYYFLYVVNSNLQFHPIFSVAGTVNSISHSAINFAVVCLGLFLL